MLKKKIESMEILNIDINKSNINI